MKPKQTNNPFTSSMVDDLRLAASNILNRLGYRLRKVVKAKPKKKSQKRMQSSRI